MACSNIAMHTIQYISICRLLFPTKNANASIYKTRFKRQSCFSGLLVSYAMKSYAKFSKGIDEWKYNSSSLLRVSFCILQAVLYFHFKGYLLRITVFEKKYIFQAQRYIWMRYRHHDAEVSRRANSSLLLAKSMSSFFWKRVYHPQSPLS